MTDMTVFQQKMLGLCPDIELRMNELLSKHTSFRMEDPLK